jgi:aldehyde:ferredoxin oxidoreductase
MKRNYYRTMGWDEATGMPLPETLRALDLEELVADFLVRT